MPKEICCKISGVLNSFLCTNKTSPSLKWRWSDQAIEGEKKRVRHSGIKHWHLQYLVSSHDLPVCGLLVSHRVNFSLHRAWSLGFVTAIAGGLFPCRNNSSVLSYLWIILKVLSWFLRFWGRRNSKPEVLYDCLERPKLILVAKTIPFYHMDFGKIRFRWSTWVWCSGS